MLKRSNIGKLRAELRISCIGTVLASYARGRVISNGKHNLKLNQREDKLMPKCTICNFEGPRECFYFIEGKLICVCCDFEDFLGDEANTPKADEIVARMLEDIAKHDSTQA